MVSKQTTRPLHNSGDNNQVLCHFEIIWTMPVNLSRIYGYFQPHTHIVSSLINVTSPYSVAADFETLPTVTFLATFSY